MGSGQKFFPIACLPQGLRGYGPDLRLFEPRQPLGEAGQAVPAALHGVQRQVAVAIKSIALSQEYNLDGGARVLPWEVVEERAPAILKKVLDVELPKTVLININFPSCSAAEIAGTRVTAQGKLSHGLTIEERHDGRGLPYYWLRYGRGKDVPAENSDVAALAKNFISVTPLQLDLTAHDTLATLASAIA